MDQGKEDEMEWNKIAQFLKSSTTLVWAYVTITTLVQCPEVTKVYDNTQDR